MADGTVPPRGARTSSTTWPVTLVVLVCVALELAVASSPVSMAARVTALLGFAAVAVALVLRQALSGLGDWWAMRAAVLAPLMFSLVVTVVLMLDAHVRGGGLAR